MSCTCGYSGPDFDCPTHGPCRWCWEVTGEYAACSGARDGLVPELAAGLSTEVAEVMRKPPRCTCTPCTSGGQGHPFIDHCAACCAGSLIETYDHQCPIADHRRMAVAQFGPQPEAPF